MSQPSEKLNWVPSDDPTKIIAPSTSKKNTGWVAEEKPPFQFFNWAWNLLSAWIHWIQGCNKYNIVISSDSNEQDFASLEAYIAGSPTAGDVILIKNAQTITAQITIPDDIEIIIAKGVIFSCTTNLASLLELGNNIRITGDLDINTLQTGTIAAVITFNGDNSFIENANINNTSTGIITDAFLIEVGKDGNLCRGVTKNTGGGTITNPLTDNSGTTSNDVIIREI